MVPICADAVNFQYLCDRRLFQQCLQTPVFLDVWAGTVCVDELQTVMFQHVRNRNPS